jgi:hypothetical protein
MKMTNLLKVNSVFEFNDYNVHQKSMIYDQNQDLSMLYKELKSKFEARWFICIIDQRIYEIEEDCVVPSIKEEVKFYWKTG